MDGFEFRGKDFAECKVELGTVVVEGRKEDSDRFSFVAMLFEIAADPTRGEKKLVTLGGSNDGGARRGIRGL